MSVQVPANLTLLVWGKASDEHLHNSPLGLGDFKGKDSIC